MVKVANIHIPSKYFWEDEVQAQERLVGCYILYDDLPYYVHQIQSGADFEDGVPRAVLHSPHNGVGRGRARNAQRITRRLDSPKFKRFRKLPALGWVNYVSTPLEGGQYLRASFLQRRSMQRRSHGLSNDNVTVLIANPDAMGNSRGPNYATIVATEAYKEACASVFPSMIEAFEAARPGDSVAFDKKFCLAKSTKGITALYRNSEAVGILTDPDTFFIFKDKVHYREELMESSSLTCSTLRELI